MNSLSLVHCSCTKGGVFGFARFLVTFFLLAQGLHAASLNDCMMEMMEKGDDALTLGQIRQQCAREDDSSVVEKRLRQDDENVLEPFTIMAHRPNYLLLFAYNSSGYNQNIYLQQLDDPSVPTDDIETQFQISIKIPLIVNLLGKDIDLFAAYTNHSFWQLYNDRSAPFRETNHEPEAWFQFRPEWLFLGFTNSVAMFGINHQSNGRGGELSRSWNRIFADFVLEKGNFALSFKPWYRLPAREEHDKNPDITDFLGHYELRAAYKWDDHVFQIMSRNNIESGFRRGAVECTWTFPFWDYPFLKGYIQYFSGYGESLMDYNNYVNKIGLGFALTDWL